ncbi:MULTISPECIES: SRPBCC family protein [unclassified Rhizobium]|uniref:SRPBCC family protein n=1 Tax=unclassified Rhizobium TaxID=2613769 RepID=UPI00161E7CCD|nr:MULTISPECIES: SRPBCC family protein [unclassified Rhizobium]
MKDMANLFDTWSLDREIVLVKLLNHPREKVFAAWMDPKALAEWYGPTGLGIESHEADIREGGIWRFDMVGVFEGQERRFPNLMRFREIVPNERIVMDYGTPDPNDPDRFRVTVTFDEQSDGKTVLTMRQLHPSPERRRFVIGFGAVEYGLQTLDGLEAWLDC